MQYALGEPQLDGPDHLVQQYVHDTKVNP